MPLFLLQSPSLIILDHSPCLIVLLRLPQHSHHLQKANLLSHRCQNFHSHHVSHPHHSFFHRHIRHLKNPQVTAPTNPPPSCTLPHYRSQDPYSSFSYAWFFSTIRLPSPSLKLLAHVSPHHRTSGVPNTRLASDLPDLLSFAATERWMSRLLSVSWRQALSSLG